jgi:class 3 adenylate cyclase
MSTASTFTVLFTDIASSTEHAVRLGDALWDAQLTSYRAAIRRELRQFGGVEVDSAGDGFFAVFASAGGAVHCAQSISTRADRLGLASRTGLHTGVCQTGGEKISGVAVHVAARVMACADPGEVLVTSAVGQALPLRASSAWHDAGPHDLRGLPGQWPLYHVS